MLRSQHEGGKALPDSKRDEGFISSSTSGAGELWSKAGYPSAAVRVTGSTTAESLCSHTHILADPHCVWESGVTHSMQSDKVQKSERQL